MSGSALLGRFRLVGFISGLGQSRVPESHGLVPFCMIMCKRAMEFQGKPLRVIKYGQSL